MPKKQKIQLYTLGYQGLTLDGYLSILLTNDIRTVVDVREKAWSYKPGFSKTAFAASLAKFDIQYIHVRSAGNPSTNRKTATSVEECLNRYRAHLKQYPQCLDDLLNIINTVGQEKRNACLTCMERDHIYCHRSILIEGLQSLNPLLRPVHLK
jgi:uncharacterized protein (DUF488 family)